MAKTEREWSPEITKPRKRQAKRLFRVAEARGLRNLSDISNHVGIPVGTLNGWKRGICPRHPEDVKAAIELIKELPDLGIIPKDTPAPMVERVPQEPVDNDSYEVDAIINCALHLEELSAAARRRVLAFLTSKYGT